MSEKPAGFSLLRMCVKGFDSDATHAGVQNYYGKVLQKTSDLKTNACVTPTKPVADFICQALKKVHPEIIAKYYGCGLVVPECLEGCSILDMGCGSGRDCYMLSQLVGKCGHITGIDMTRDQVKVARKHVDYHMREFGYEKPNVRFVEGYAEALIQAGIEEQSLDIIVSNCVVNLCPDKKLVLNEAFSVLKDGGEMYFSDVYSSERLSDEIKNHKVLWGECIAGALWWQDLHQLAEEVGFSPPRLVTASPITVDNKQLQDILGDIKFVSATYRLFKVSKGQIDQTCQVVYNGNITGAQKSFQFDCQNTFTVNEVVKVDGEVSNILARSRFSEEFTFQPQGTALDTCGVKPKEDIVNPFDLIQQLPNAAPGLTTRGRCCSQATAACCK